MTSICLNAQTRSCLVTNDLAKFIWALELKVSRQFILAREGKTAGHESLGIKINDV